MIGTTLQQVSRARSNTARILALFLTLSLMTHGLFFSQEWFFFGFALSIYGLLSNSLGLKFVTGRPFAFGLTDALFLAMLLCSLLGVVHPVKVKDGFIEALHWGTLWFVYRLGVQISSDEIAKEHLVNYIEWLAIIVALIGWLPWVSKVAGRLSSVFGYPNATAAFLGAALLLCPRRRSIQIFLGISLLGTGSRAGVGLFSVILIGQQLLLRVRSHHIVLLDTLRQMFQAKGIRKNLHTRGLWALSLGLAGTILMMLDNRAVWENLTAWGFSSTSWQERLVYFKDGKRLAWSARGLPQAGGWMAFPTVQHFPYWTADPHSSIIHILLNQGFFGTLCVGIWGAITLARARKTWVKNYVPFVSSEGGKGTNVEVRMWGALLFLVLHSLVDADFSFGALGVLFWTLFGSLEKRNEHPRLSFSMRNKLMLNLSSKGRLFLIIILCLASGSALLNPKLLEKEKIWNRQARLKYEQDPTQSMVLWNKSLNWDQTQTSGRREQAELLLKHGNTEVGLKAVEEVLRWQSFDLEVYEWAQSIVWDAAEMQRHTHPETAIRLYLWVESVPQKIEGRVTLLSLTDRLLWKSYRDFLPSEHIKLLAEYARQRQLTQLPPRT